MSKTCFTSSGRLYSPVMFKIPSTSLYDAVRSSEHFDTFFYWNRPKNETVPP